MNHKKSNTESVFVSDIYIHIVFFFIEEKGEFYVENVFTISQIQNSPDGITLPLATNCIFNYWIFSVGEIQC